MKASFKLVKIHSAGMRRKFLIGTWGWRSIELRRRRPQRRWGHRWWRRCRARYYDDKRSDAVHSCRRRRIDAIYACRKTFHRDLHRL